ncbi:hypothetical protein FIBSPDRAFT_874717 [Athelia psychrophila]|uniref:Uncharacterized protein n=1 Tax=Athelia psychrophila TaxID=1759441 RepID=A0A165X806_9AGAM|nr:hypothetical protein FIBSPDRAFT_874717 [Fibularhizoctonia sp. CBS 109695]
MTIITRRKAALRRNEGGQVSMYIIDDRGSPSKVGAGPALSAQRPIQPWPTLSSLSTLTDSTLSVGSHPSTIEAPRTPEPHQRGSWHPHLAPKRAPPLTRSPDRIGGHGINFWRNDDASGVFTRGMINGIFHERRDPHPRQLDGKEERAAMAARQAHLENRLIGPGRPSTRGENDFYMGSLLSDDDEAGQSMQEDESEGHSQLHPEDTIIIDHEALASALAPSLSGQAMGAESTILIDHSQATDGQRSLALCPRRQGRAPLGLRPTEPVV